MGKLLVSPARVESPRWANLTLTQAEEFIVQRMQAHARNKQGDRLRFPDPLMQFLAWKHGVPQSVPEHEGVVVADHMSAP